VRLPTQVNDDRKLFVGNLAWAVDGLDLEDIFKEFGTVESAQARRPRMHARRTPTHTTKRRRQPRARGAPLAGSAASGAQPPTPAA
jgi:RNA recognition motif-containing protein